MVNNPLEDQAIQCALCQDWSQAIELNLEILDEQPYHIPTLNRLAKAYAHTGQMDKASTTYQQVLEIDPYNGIAKKNIEALKEHSIQNNAHAQHTISTDFIDEPGITKTIPLVRLGNSQLLTNLQPGESVNLVCNSHLVNVVTPENEHIGTLTDDIAFFLRSCLQEGNTYLAVIKQSSPNGVSVFVREVTRTGKFKHIPTFSNC